MNIWDLIQEYRDDTGATEAAILRRANLNKGTFTAWRKRGVPGLPEHAHVIGLASALKRSYAQVLGALLESTGYADEVQARGRAITDAAAGLLTAAKIQEAVADLLARHDGNESAARHSARAEYFHSDLLIKVNVVAWARGRYDAVGNMAHYARVLELLAAFPGPSFLPPPDDASALHAFIENFRVDEIGGHADRVHSMGDPTAREAQSPSLEYATHEEVEAIEEDRRLEAGEESVRLARATSLDDDLEALPPESDDLPAKGGGRQLPTAAREDDS